MRANRRDPGDPTVDIVAPRQPLPLTRRRFLVIGSAFVATSILGACMDDDDDDEGDDGTPTLVGATRTPDSAIETPQVGASPTGSPPASPTTGDEVSTDLARFMSLSRALTGFDELDDTELGQVYLDSFTGNDDLSGQLDALYEKAGMAEGASEITLEQLEEAGAFDDDTRPVADAITTAWYTGSYDAGDDQLAIATYINALAWQATGYRLTGPSTCSGATGNWSAAAA